MVRKGAITVTAAAKAKIDNLTMGLPPLSVRDLNALVARLPPAEHAALTWAPAAIEVELKRLREEPLDTDLVNESTLAIFTQFSKAFAVIVQALGAPFFLAELKSIYRSEGESLDRFLPDSGARRSARWAMRAFLGFLEAIPLGPEIREASLDPGLLAQPDLAEAFKDDAAGVIRAVVLLMAAVSIAERDGDKERAADLADRAFLEASRGVDHLARLGLSVELEAEVTPARPGCRVLECVEEARAALAPEDVAVLVQARLHELR
jgi:hypothetical protein